MTKKVSIIVPVYNGEKTIKACVESILNQSLKELELIIVDDGSSDNTRNICQSFSDDRINYFYKENGGVSSARNFGITVATGEYIGFVDADDCITKEMCEKMYMQGSEYNADICVCDYAISFSNKELQNYTDLLRNGKFNREQIQREILPNFLGHIDDNGNIAKYDWAVIRRFFRREFILSKEIMFEEILFNSEDCLFSFKATYHATTIVYLKNQYLYINYRNPNSLTRQYLNGYWEQRCMIIDAIEYMTTATVDIWKSESFLLFVMRCIRPSFINISYGFDEQNTIDSLKQFHTIVNDKRTRKMCELLDYETLNDEWKKEFLWCKQKSFISLYWYYKDIYQGSRVCRAIRILQKRFYRFFKVKR